MVYVFSFLLWIVSAGRYLFSPATSALAYLFILSIAPRYIGIGLSGEGFALTAIRAVTFTIFALIILKTFIKSSHDEVFVPEVRPFIIFSLLLYAVSFVGVFQYGSLLYGLMYFVEDIATLIVSLYFGWHIAIRKDGRQALIWYAFIVPGFFAAFLVLIEVVRQAPVLAGVIQIDSTIATNRDFFTANSIRGGVYRAKALFDGALQLGEFATYGFAAALTCFIFRIFSRPLMLCSMAAFVFIMYSSGSRSAILVAGVSAASIVIIYMLRFGLKQYGRPVAWFTMFSGAVLILYSVLLLLGDVGFDPAVYLIDDARERSTVVRLLQYRVVPELIAGSPFYGVGYQRNYVLNFDSLIALDNYYLKILLQSGYVGIFLLFCSMLFLFMPVVKLAFSNDRNSAFMGTLGLGVLLAFAMYKLFISGESNNAYIYILYFFLLHRQRLSNFVKFRKPLKKVDLILS